MKKYIFIFLQILGFSAFSQTLKPGFDAAEYRELMLVSTRTTASPNYFKDFDAPKDFKMLYQSKVMGLDNLWDLWEGKNVAAISIRGTTQKPESWLANFYAAMVPAKGELKISETETFKYNLADNPKAAVHVGWLISTAFLSKDMLPKIGSLYKTGTKEFLIIGHSQGGAISYLLTAYLLHLQKENQLPADIKFKTYSSASPKPGNLYFAYDYEALTQNGWAYNVVNSADWVPEVPMSIQTLNDFNDVNPFINAKMLIKKQKFPTNLVLKHVFNRLDKPTKKAQESYERYLGKATSKIIMKSLKTFEAPDYYHSNHYVRTGNTIVLLANEDYYKHFPDDQSKIFVHHFHQNYLYLLDHQFGNK
ncbi:lipase family protein [Pelobium sp.]|nr:lipase family protein [Pelobium sp.]MDA9554971.1 lipase family protein [Pelobium sp.]